VVVGWLRGQGHNWTLAIRVLAPLGALVVEGWPALIGAVVVQEACLWLAGRLTETCQRPFCKQLFLAAYGLRVVIALPTHYFAKLGNGNGSFFPDDYTNDLVGEWLLRIARGDGTVSIFAGHQQVLEGLYPYLLMAVYAVFGYTPLLPKLLNICLGALSAVLAATYLLSVLAFEAVLRPLTGGSEVAVALSTLGVVALFAPARRRIQSAVDRRFYRSRYDATRTLDAFTVRLGDEVDLDAVRADLVEVVQRTLQPAHASVWLRPE